MDALIKWWFVVCCCILGLVTLQGFNLFEVLWDVDYTKISFAIIGIFSVITFYVGVLTWRTAKRPETIHITQSYLPFCWYSAGAMTTLGMIGTVIGFLLMLGTAFQGMNFGDIKAAQVVIREMAVGIATALTTTLTGLTCSEILKLQLVNLEKAISDTLAKVVPLKKPSKKKVVK